MSSDQICPICGENMSIYNDYKPFENICGECVNCGFSYYTKVEQMSLAETNERRAGYDLKPIKKEQLEKYSKEIKEIW